MTILKTSERPEVKSKKSNEETLIQIECVKWFRETYKEYSRLFFAVINENDRSGYETKIQQKISGSIRRQKGVVAGVSDTLLLVASGGYHGLCAECKTSKGTQSDNQKSWQSLVEKQGYYYFVFRSLDEFKEKIQWYLSLL